MALLDFSTAPYGGEQRLLPEHAAQPRIRPTQLIFHSIVGSAEGAFNFFRAGSALESTFIVTKSGQVWQLMDTERRSDANAQANVRAGSVETEDNGDPDTDPWTPQQLEALAWIGREYHRLHGVPLRQCPRWDASGFGYHRLFPQWSTVRGKTCPGDVRVRQYERVLLPAIVRGEDPDMPYGHWPADHRQALVRDVAAAVKDDVTNLDRLLLQFLAAGQSNSVFPGGDSDAWRREAVSTRELDERLQQLFSVLGAAARLTRPTPGATATPAGVAAELESAEVAAALQARIDADAAADAAAEGVGGRVVDVALLQRAVTLLRSRGSGGGRVGGG